MPKYLLEIQYTLDGVKGVLAKGGNARIEAATEVVESAGGKLEAFYFTFGKRDAVTIVDMPDNAAMAAVALTVSAGGGAKATTTPLLTADEIDAASKASVTYRPPGK